MPAKGTQKELSMQCLVKICNTSGHPLPALQTEGASGFDLTAAIDEPLTLRKGVVGLVPTGIYLEVPKGFEAQVRARSGLAAKHGVTLVNGIGTIDSDYRGEIKVILTTLKDSEYVIEPGERIAQLVIAPIVLPVFETVDTPEELGATSRGDGGFGHSGK